MEYYAKQFHHGKSDCITGTGHDDFGEDGAGDGGFQEESSRRIYWGDVEVN